MKAGPITVAILGIATVPVKGQQARKAAPAREALQAKLSRALPAYQPSGPLSGEIRSAGEDTMETLVKLWAEAFTKVHPKVRFSVEARGSSTVAPALTDGTADIGVIGRNWPPRDAASFERKYGYKPFAVRVGTASYQNPNKIRAVAVVVHGTNPIDRLSLDQLDAVFSKTRKRGYKEDVTTWGQLGLTGEWASRPITLYGIKRPSGVVEYLQDRVLDWGEFKEGIKEWASLGPVKGLDVVVGVLAQDPGGIGYARFGYANPNVKTVALAEKEGGPYYEGSFEEVVSHRYPLSRFVYIFLNRAPGKPIAPKIKEFLRFLLSNEGQQTLQKEGDFLPLPSEIVKQERARLE